MDLPFLIVVFQQQDLKKYQFYYWFAFPALVYPSKIILKEDPKELDQLLTPDEVNH